MAEDILSQFLIRIAYQQDDKSRKDFDEGLKQVQTRAADFGEKIGALPLIVSEATKRISSSLTEMYYAGQKNGATARELDALRYAAEQSGEGADNASASFNAFSQRVRDFATGTAAEYKSMFGVPIDPNHTFDAFLQIREKIEELRNRGGADNLSRANLYARTFLGGDEDALIPGRLDEFNKRIKEALKRNEGIAAEKAVALTRAYNALAAALETVARKADSALFDKFGAVLDRLTKWLDEDSDRIVKFFTDLVTQVGLVFTDLGVLKPAFALLWDALKEVGGWLQKIIGQPDSTGLAGVRHLLEFISGVEMARFVASMVAGFIAAFAPLTALLAALAALGIIAVGAYTAGAAVRGWLGGGEEPGFGGQGGTDSAGRGAARRGRMGYRGSPRGEKAIRASRADVSADAAMIRKAAIDAGVDPDVAVAVAKSEGLGTSYAGGDYGSSFGPFQMHFGGMAGGSNRGAGLGDVMLRETGIDARDPKNKEAVVKWALKYAKVHGWGDWNGAARIGIGSRQGLDYTPRPVVAAKPSVRPSIPNPFAHWDPNFDEKLKIFKDAKPLGTDQHSMNEIHDHRTVTNDVNIHVAGTSTKDLTVRQLGRPRNADLIRNTASYAA